MGVSQISGASRTSVGGYDKPETEDEVTSAQFDVSDQRTLDEIVNWLMNMGDIPSFCTACYRAGRTGDRFMSLCKSKQISNCCHPNALMTLMEYLQDYASPETKKVGLELIQNVNGTPTASVVLQDQVIQFPYDLDITGAPGISEGTLYLSEQINGTYQELGNYSITFAKAE